MSLATAVRILTQHGVSYRFGGSWIELESAYAFDGGLTWVDCPTSAADLYRWLGY